MANEPDGGRQDVVLSVSDLSKAYAAYGSNLKRFASWFGLGSEPESLFWANRGIGFDLPRGQSVGVIGQNGAGKSTFLKLVTGTVVPTHGRVTARGSVSSVLELGMGFNPEFTARQNVMTAGGMLGFTDRDLRELMPFIEDFTELGAFFDRPLRVYSTGMQARLSFALATARRPDLLIVDEVLSVGDSYFQHKSFDRIRSFRDEGTSILLVTHSLEDVRTLCDRAILLDHGEILKDGAPDEVVDYYNAMIAAKENEVLAIDQRREASGWLHSRSGTSEAVFERFDLLDAATGDPVKIASVGQALRIRAHVRAGEALDRLVLGVMLRDRAGTLIFGTNSYHAGTPLVGIAAGERIAIDITFENRLGPGSYGLTAALHADDTHIGANYEWQENAIVFDVVNVDRPYFIGAVELQTEFAVERS